MLFLSDVDEYSFTNAVGSSRHDLQKVKVMAKVMIATFETQIRNELYDTKKWLQ